MATQEPPDDRAVILAITRLKAWSGMKGRQVQSLSDGQVQIDPALVTVETWAADTADSGKAWGDRKQAQADRDVEESNRWNDRVRKDDAQAADERRAASEMDTKQIKKTMFDALDQYQAGIKEQADAGAPWAAAKLAEVSKEHGDLKKTIDQGLEPTMNQAATKNAARRRKNRLIAERTEAKAEEARKWKAAHADNPAAQAAGQRADVEAALDQIGKWAGQTIWQIEPLGSRAAEHVKALQEVQTWAGQLKPQVSARGPALASAKGSGRTGVAQARAARDKVEVMLNAVESESNDAQDVFARWAEHNNQLAQEWIKSDSREHRAWAEAWLGRKKQG